MNAKNSLKPDELTSFQRYALITALALLTVGAFSVIQLIEKRYQENLQDNLTTVLGTVNQALTLWEEEQYLYAKGFATEEHVIESIKELLATPRNARALLQSEALQHVRDEYHPFSTHFRGFFVIGPDNINLASSRDSNIGVTNLLQEHSDILSRIWAGESLITPFQHSDVPLDTGNQHHTHSAYETQFIGTPVRDETGQVIALITFRIDPYRTMFALADKGRLGETGETYFFDEEGMMLSRSRFEPQLVSMGLLEDGQSSALNIMVRDPGIDLRETGAIRPAIDKLPLTRMAVSAVDGNNDSDVTGYRDYRGVPVIGTWIWIERLGIGVTTEQDVDEAYGLFYFVRNLVYGGTTITAIIILLLVRVFILSKRELAQIRIRLQAVVESSNDGIVVINDRGIIESVNPAMETLFGYPGELMIGNNISMLMPEPFSREHDGYLSRYRETNEENIIGTGREVIAKRKDGSLFPIDLSVNRLEIAHGLHFAGTIRDITERKIAEHEIQEARIAAEEANKAKSTFLATMSHEIRTPLNGVVGTVDMLSHTPLKDSQLDLVETAKESAIMLQGIIDDILDFSKIEAGRLELDLTPFSLESLLETLADSMQTLAIQRDIELLVYCDPELPVMMGDPVRIKQILFNLVGNAMKFSGDQTGRKGQVVVSATLEASNDDRADICLRVRDNGIGMSAEVQQRLFNPFVQGEADTTRKFGGTGLGLVITKRLVEMMRGNIMVESVEGEGATFSAHISLKRDDTSTEVDTSVLDGIRVLLVSGDEAGWILTGYLQHAGAELVPVAGMQLVEAISEQSSDDQQLIIIIDIQSNYDVAIALRDKVRDSFKAIEPRFLLVERGKRRYARYADNDTMTLDLDAMHRSSLLNAVATLAGRESSLHSVKNKNNEMLFALDESPKKDSLILLVDDNATNRKVIGQQLQMLGYVPETAEDGVEALEKWKEKEFALVLTDCHMPEMDGYGLAEAIRREEGEGQRIPIIAITADALKGAADKCFSAGMDDYLTKPVQLENLQLTLQRWLSDRVDESSDRGPVAPDQQSDDDVIDSRVLGDLLGSQEKEFLAEYYEDFLETSTPTVEQIQLAFKSNDLPELSSQAHKLKSSARTVGANELADCCLELEMAGKEGDAQVAAQQVEQLRGLYTQVTRWIANYCGTD